jgi:hypothetical protein
MQIFNPDFAKDPNIRQRLVKEFITNEYGDFHRFFMSDLYLARETVNIIGCSMGESDDFLWHSFMEKYNQSGNGTVNVYDIYKKTFRENNKKYNYSDPEKARENEILCSMLVHCALESDSSEVTAGIFNEDVSITEEYIAMLEQNNKIKGSRMSRYSKIKEKGDMEKYVDVIDR